MECKETLFDIYLNKLSVKHQAIYYKLVDIIVENTSINKSDLFRLCRDEDIVNARHCFRYNFILLTGTKLKHVGIITQRAKPGHYTSVIHSRDTWLNMIDPSVNHPKYSILQNVVDLQMLTFMGKIYNKKPFTIEGEKYGSLEEVALVLKQSHDIQFEFNK